MIVRAAWYAGVCPVCGLEVLSPGPEAHDGSRLELFEARATTPRRVIPLDTQARFPVVQHGAVHRIAFSGQDGFAYVATDDGQPVRKLGPIYARMGTGFTPDGRAAWQDTQHSYRVDGETTSRPCPNNPDGSVSGFSGDPAQLRNWVDRSFRADGLVQSHGLTLFNPTFSPDGDLVFGFHPNAPQFLFVKRSTDELFIGGHTFDTQALPMFVMANGEPAVVRSNPSGLVRLSEMVPYVPVVSVDTTPMPPAPRLARAFLFGAYFSRSGDESARAQTPDRSGISSAAGNVELPIRPTADQISKLARMAILPADVATQTPAGKLEAVYVHLDGNASPVQIAADIAVARAVADSRGVGLVVYDDRSGCRRALIEPHLTSRDYICPQWYLEVGESDDTFRRRIIAELDGLRGLRVVATVAAYLRTGRLTRTDMARSWRVLFQVAEERSDLLGYLYFAQLRADGVDGEAAYLSPMLHAFAEGLTGLPAHPMPAPSQPAPGPAPTPTPTPTPVLAPPDQATHFPKARLLMSEKIRIAIRHAGKFIGVDPTPVTSLPAVGRRGKATPVTGDDQFPVYQDRDQPGAWETLEATSHGDAKNPFYDLLAMSSQRQLSWTDENRFESRAAGVLGAWESRFRIAEQPDGRCLGWRDDRIDHVFEVIKL